MLFRKIITVYSENHTKPINTFYGQNSEELNVKAGASKGQTTSVKHSPD
jgi:hypothetical protein